MLPSERLSIGAAHTRRDLSIKFKIALASLQRTVIRAKDYPSIWLFTERPEGGSSSKSPRRVDAGDALFRVGVGN